MEMFHDIEDYGGYDKDLCIETEADNHEIAESSKTEQFFPTDLSDDEIEEIDSKRLKTSSIKDFQPEALDWYLRVNLDGDSDNKKCLTETNNEMYDKTIERIQLQKEFGGLLTNKNESKKESRRVFPDDEPIFNKMYKNPCQIFKFPPRNSVNWSAITSLHGQRYYVLTKPKEDEHKFSISSKFANKTLIDNFSEILQEAENLNERKREEDWLLQDVQTTETDVSTSSEIQSLWVDRYKARFYTDLLSDDGVNRTLLTWLKLWDECVFKIVKPKAVCSSSSLKPAVSKFFNGFGSNKTSNVWKQPPNGDNLSKELDQHRRPQYKVALMCGPPGVGKTTLAHICARHCGYFVHEMNASDDRTLEAFRKQLENATQMTATLDGGFRPHCLIIDEIDGAPSQSIDYLVGLIKGGDSNDAVSVKKSKKQILLRPIICICNDLYVPALKELRKVALVLHVPSIEPRRLSDRLNCVTKQTDTGDGFDLMNYLVVLWLAPTVIGKRENVVLGSPAVEILCEKTENDVRSCINTLQFLAFGKSDKKISALDVSQVGVGLKDLHKSLFTVWQEIFTLPKVKRKLHQESISSVNPTSLKSRVNSISTIVDQSGEVDRIVDGLFENFLNMGFKDAGMDMVCRALAWLQMYDRLDAYISQYQCYEFFPYKKFVPILFHLYFASSANIPRIQFPQILSTARFNTTKNSNTLKTLLSDMQPCVRLGIHLSPLLMEILPYLLIIIQPAFRAVNIQMYSLQEREKLDKLVKLMCSYNLAYRQERAVDGQYVFVLEPAVDDIVKFAIPNVCRQQLSYVLKQFIAREIEMSKLSTSVEPKLISKHKDTSKQKPAGAVAVAAKSKIFVEDSYKCKNFFCLPSSSETSACNNNGKVDLIKETDASRIWFKYNEGSSNAIRRNVKVADMI